MSSREPIALFARLLLAAVVLLAGQGFSQDGDGYLRLALDQARVLKLDRAVSKVIIGNDQIADATVADARTIILTGRSFGTTNLVLLDSDGNAIADERILVALDEAKTVRVYRQTDRAVLSCAPNCELKKNTGSAAATTTAAGS